MQCPAAFGTDVNAKTLPSRRGRLVALIDLDGYTCFLQSLCQTKSADTPSDNSDIQFSFHFFVAPDFLLNRRLACSVRIHDSVCF